MSRKYWVLFILFFLLNFGALALGSFLMGVGPMDPWYQDLNKAPWTPPGWVFGAAWFTIMLCLSIALSNHFSKKEDKSFAVVYSIHLVFNIIWNYLFFNIYLMMFSLIDIVVLTGLVGYMMFYLGKAKKINGILLAPYFIWLCIATSLNMYALVHN